MQLTMSWASGTANTQQDSLGRSLGFNAQGLSLQMDSLVGALWRWSKLCDVVPDATDGVLGERGGIYATGLASLGLRLQGPGPFFCIGSL